MIEIKPIPVPEYTKSLFEHAEHIVQEIANSACLPKELIENVRAASTNFNWLGAYVYRSDCGFHSR